MYLSKADKDRIDLMLDKVTIVTPQELGYGILKLTMNHLDIATGSLSDNQLTNVLGVMERAKQEFHTRVVAVFETHRRRTTVDSFHEFIRRRNI